MRKAQVFEVACSSPEHAGQTMTLHVAGPFSSFDPNLAVTGMRADRTIDVKVETLDHVLSEGEAPRPIDLMSVDVEGHELEVLSGFDFERWQPRLILLEDHVSSLDKHRFMKRAGYSLMRRTGLNGWYVPRRRRRRWTCSGAGRFSANIIWRCRSGCSATGGGGCATASAFGDARDMPRLSAIVIAKNEAKNIDGLSRLR